MSTKFAIIPTIAGLLLTIVEPGLGAPQPYRQADAYASGAVIHKRATHHASDRSSGRFWSNTRYRVRRTAAEPLGPGRNLPYPDRPYGHPDSW